MATIGDRLKDARKDRGLTQKELAARMNLKSPSAISNWETGVSEPNMADCVALCKILDIELSYLLDYYGGKGRPITAADDALLHKYHRLDEHGQELVDTVLNIEYKRCTKVMPAQDTRSVIWLNEYGKAAAGPNGAWFSDDAPDRIPVAETPESRHADYLVIVSGDSMEPQYQDGDLLLVQQTSVVDPGALGVFAYDGKGYFKKLGADGQTLVSLNPKYPPIIPGSDPCFTQGRVLGKAQRVDE